jgi:hypothetical protein
MRNGRIYAQATWVRRTEGKESGLWRTPCERDNHPSKIDGKNTRKDMQIQLAHQVKMWPTPQSFDAKATEKWQPGSEWDRNKKEHTLPKAVKMWPTPRQFMYKDTATDRGKGNLGEVVGGSLNPTWVEWLMGYPSGWTDLSVSVTPLSLKSQKSCSGE